MRRIQSLLLLIVISLGTAGMYGCMKEEFGGVGIEVPAGIEKVSKKNPFVIVSVFKGGTGESAGLLENDVIVRVDGMPLDGLQQDYIVKNFIRGKAGSTVTLEIIRDVNGVKTNMVFRILRGNIVLQK